MEKINDCKINLMNISILRTTVCVFLLAAFLMSPPAQAQIRAGSGYLKMLTGAREIGLSGTLTAALDHGYAFYANPAATGFSREWQWSATYTRWISDLYNASFLYGRKIHTPWSRLTKFMLGVNYLGIPEFNNVSGINAAAAAPVSGNNLLVTASLGQPLSLISHNLSLGANVKYFNSELAEFKADAVIYDLGLLYRTPRYSFLKPVKGLLDYVIFSGGLSITNMGDAIVFIAEETPLPQTVRAGIAANIGSHRGIQLSVGSDYRLVRDEDGYLTFGSEVSWRQLISLRLGYSRENNLLGNFTFGGTIRLDDRMMKNALVGRNNALRLDLAISQNNDYFASPYHGSITHQPIGPERFNLISPAYNEKIASDSVTLKWELTTDPDLFDDIEHWLVVDRDSNQLAAIQQMVDNNDDSLLLFLKATDFLVNQRTIQNQLVITDLAAGTYFWAVVAYDNDHHLRLAKLNHHNIAKFQVTAPDPRVIALDFEYSPWITEDDYQGVLKITISNLGNRAAKDFSLSIFDSLVNDQSVMNIKNLIATKPLPIIEPGQVVKIESEWRTKPPGLHQIRAEITSSKRTVNQFGQTFYTIPKGVFTTNDTVIVQENFHFIYDLPYIGKIFFDSSSAAVKASYFDDWVIEPPLAVFAKRLQQNPVIKIKLQGTIDPNSAEQDITLANQRALAVRDSLHRLGVSLDQIEILPGNKLPARPVTRITADTQWILEERRRVDITSDPEFEESLFQPLETTYIDKTVLPIPFRCNINGAVPLAAGHIKLASSSQADSLDIKAFLDHANLIKNIEWLLMPDDPMRIEAWLQQQVDYSLVLIDTLDRRFQVGSKETYFDKQVSGRQRKYYILANFAQASPFYSFYWSNLLKAIPIFLEDKNILICFQGHGCAIGSDQINAVLSKQRAATFMEKFLQDVQKYYPELYDDVKQRTDLPQGFGETEPLSFKTLEGKVVFLGDNSTPLGRQMNRRVMVCFSPRGK